MIRSLLMVVAATIGVSLSLPAQEDSTDVPVFTGSFTAGTREFVRVFLQKGQVYRAEINLGDVSFTIRPRRAGGEQPTIARIRGGPGSGEAVFEIYPFKDDEYEVTVADFPEGETATLQIYRDIAASRRRQGIASGGSGTHWYLGVEVAYASHGSYAISRVEIDPDRSSGGLEGCVTLRPSRGGFSGCLIGVTKHTGDRVVDVLWVFAEPRFALLRGHGISRPEVGVLLRGAFGSNQDVGDEDPFQVDNQANPAMLGFGAYAKIWPQGEQGRGFSLGVSVQHAILFGVQELSPSFNQIGVNIGLAF